MNKLPFSSDVPNISSLSSINGTYKFIAGGLEDVVGVSYDAVSWILSSNNFVGGASVNSATYGNGIYIIVGNFGNISTSTDGLVWVNHSNTDLGTNNIHKIIFDGTKFYCVGNGGILGSSVDGITWTLQTVPSGTIDLYGIYYDGTTYLVVGNNGTVLTSTDGISWNLINSDVISNQRLLSVITKGHDTWVIAGQAGVLYYSTDLVNWIASTNPATNQYGINGLVFDESIDMFIFIADHATVCISSDAVNWIAVDLPFMNNENLSGLSSINGQTVIVSPMDHLCIGLWDNFEVNIPDNIDVYYLVSGDTINNGIINLPSKPVDGYGFTLISNCQISKLEILSNSTLGFDTNQIITKNKSLTFKYSYGLNTWFLI